MTDGDRTPPGARSERYVRLLPMIPQRAEQLLWFAGLWLAGIGVVGSVAYVIRAVLL